MKLPKFLPFATDVANYDAETIRGLFSGKTSIGEYSAHKDYSGNYSTQYENTYNAYNIALGHEALDGTGGADITGIIAIGHQALSALSSGTGNSAVGYQALNAQTTGVQNTAIGYQALLVANHADASANTCVGYKAGVAITEGTDNVCIGKDAGDTLAHANNNTIVGALADVNSATASARVVIGRGCTGHTDNTGHLGINSAMVTIGFDESDTSWAAESDERYKENIETSTAGLSFVNDLRPVTYNWKKAKDVPVDMPAYKEGSDEPVLGNKYGKTYHGFVAQEVKEVIDNHSDIKEGFRMWQEYGNGVQAIAKGNVVPMLVKAIQELSAKVEALENK